MSDLRACLTAIYQDLGELTPAGVVDAARPEKSPLHERFEWDDQVAGEEFRRLQASELIRSVRIEYAQSPEPKSVRAWVARRDAGQAGRGYVPVEEVVVDDVAMQVVRRQFEREVQELRRKYGHLDEFAEIMKGAAA